MPERHILRWVHLYSGRDYSYFYGPYGDQSELEMRLGWDQLRNTDVLGSVVGMGSGTESSHILWNYFKAFVFYTYKYFYQIEESPIIILRGLS